jgi:hypothetical protein
VAHCHWRWTRRRFLATIVAVSSTTHVRAPVALSSTAHSRTIVAVSSTTHSRAPVAPSSTTHDRAPVALSSMTHGRTPAALSSATQGRAPVVLSSTTHVLLTSQSVFPTPWRNPPPASLNLPPASPIQISRLWVCAPHQRLVDVSLALIPEPRERSR